MSAPALHSRPGYHPLRAKINRRASVRLPSSVETFCILPGAEPFGSGWQAEVHDISIGGIGLIGESPLEEGTTLDIQLHNLIQGYAANYVATVVHVTQDAAGTWLIGCRFLRELGDEELKGWTA